MGVIVSDTQLLILSETSKLVNSLEQPLKAG